MNERIKELLKQTGFTVARGWGLKDTVPEDVFIANVCVSNEVKKFTELMIEQFDLILANEYLDCVGENDKKSQFRIDRLRERVKEYFGVEE
jgi:hypothetical protein